MEDARGAGARTTRNAGCLADGRANQPPRHRIHHLVSKIAEIDGGEIITYTGNYDFYERERAIRESNQQAAFARQQSMLAKEQRFIDRFRTHAAKAAQVQSRIKALDKIEKIELP